MGTIARVQAVRGVPRLLIDGRETAPVCYLPSAAEYTARQDAMEMKWAAEYGVRLLVIPYSPRDHADRAGFTERLRDDIRHKTAISDNPGAYIILRIDCDMPAVMVSSDGGEARVFNGNQSDEKASPSSDAWYEAAKAMLMNIAGHVKADPLLDERVIGYEIMGCDSCEWFGPGYWDNLMDTSEPNRRAFARWLTDAYPDDDALRAAWADPTVARAGAPLPPFDRVPGVYNEAAQRGNVDAGKTFLLSPEDRRFVDYLDYYSEARADRITGLCEAVKRVCGGDKLTIVYYGYHADCYTPSSGHFATARMLRSPHVDALSGPVGYQDRCDGGIGAFMGMADAVAAAGKLWMDEGDYRSPLHVDPPGLPYPATTALLDQTIRREMGKCMAHDAGVWWLSFNQGWFNYREFWENTKELTGLMERYRAVKSRRVPEVCYVLDEAAMSLCGSAGAAGLQLIRLARTALYRSGYAFGMYLLEDLLAGRIDDAKLYIFPDPWRLSPEKAAAVAAKVRGKTTLYMVGSGATAAGDFAAMSGLRLEAASGPGGWAPVMDIADGLEPELGDPYYTENLPHGITAALAELAFPELNPVYHVLPGPGVKVLGTYRGGPADGKTGLALAEPGDRTSLFYGGLKLSPALLALAAGKAGVHAYAPRGDVLDTDGRLVMLHVSDPGDKTIRLPAVCDIYLVDEKRWLHADSVTHRDLPRGRTVLLFYGDRRELEKVVEDH